MAEPWIPDADPRNANWIARRAKDTFKDLGMKWDPKLEQYVDVKTGEIIRAEVAK